MFGVLAHQTYRKLFSAQMLSLIGTGLTTVALGLLAFDLAGNKAGSVLGTALAIKMIAYVGLSPVMGALTEKMPRRGLLIVLNLIRAGIVAFLPFVTEVWQVYVLIFLMQSASAAYTPAFQAIIPNILTKEEDYTHALSLSRLAYDLENLVSPMIAAALLTVMSFHNLFLGTVFGFLISAFLVFSTQLPSKIASPKDQKFLTRATKGLRNYLSTPRLRGLLSINVAVASAGAMVIVNTVVLVQGQFSLSEQQTALALAAFGGGSMLAAIILPSLLNRITDRSAMLAACAFLILGVLLSANLQSYGNLLVLWFIIGANYAIAQIPSGRLLKRSANEQERPSIFTAQFALSHFCWLFTYPIAGWIGATYGLPFAAYILAALSAIGMAVAFIVWPSKDI